MRTSATIGDFVLHRVENAGDTKKGGREWEWPDDGRKAMVGKDVRHIDDSIQRVCAGK